MNERNDLIKWVTLCKRTNYPKLDYIKHLLDTQDIPHRMNGDSWHAPILEVPEELHEKAWREVICMKYTDDEGNTIEFDEIPDDDPYFNEPWKW